MFSMKLFTMTLYDIVFHLCKTSVNSYRGNVASGCSC